MISRPFGLTDRYFPRDGVGGRPYFVFLDRLIQFFDSDGHRGP